MLLLPSGLPCPSFASLSLTPLGWVPIVSGFLPNLWPSGLVLTAIFGEEAAVIFVFQRIMMKTGFPTDVALGQSLMS